MLALVANAVLLLALGVWLVRLLASFGLFGWGRALRLGVLGAIAAVACLALEQYVAAWIAPPNPRPGGESLTPLLSLLSFFAPLEEGAKVLLVRASRKQQAATLRAAVPLSALWIAIGFAIGESAWQFRFGPRVWFAVLLVGSLGHLFFACAWALPLGDRSRAWGFAWVLATVFHGLFDHLLTSHARPVWALLAPTLISAAGAAWFGVRDLRRRPAFAPSSHVLHLSKVIATERAHWPWILGGGFVTVGVTLVGIALTVVLGRALNVDFSVADEADLRANVPIALLACGLAVSFVFAGYLVARASGTTSVIEPALASALALGFFVILLSVTAPVASVFALAVAPFAFALACAGAWFGLR